MKILGDSPTHHPLGFIDYCLPGANPMKRRNFLLLLLACFTSLALAISDPVALLQNTADRVTTSLKNNRVQIQRDTSLLHRIIKRIVLPHMDVYSMSRAVLGRNVWRKASKTQRKEFIKQFTTLVINTYAAAFKAYRDEEVKFLPVRGGYQGKSFLQVKSVIVQKGGPPISVKYSVVASGGRWRIYDFSVDGVSLIRSYRAQFQQEVNKGGMPRLINTLRQHNRKKT